MNQARDEQAAGTWPDYRVVARNISRHAEPNIHRDETAKAYGFKRALIAGRALYSHLLHPAAARWGEAWLGRQRSAVRFLQPAYDGDRLTVHVAGAPADDPTALTVAGIANAEGLLLARLESDRPRPFPAPHALALAPAPRDDGTRAPGDWAHLALGQALPAQSWTPRAEDNRAWCAAIGETLPLFLEGEAPPLHPGLLPSATTELLHRFLLIGAWVHVASVFVAHRLVRAGEALELRATPLDKWERAGRQFIQVYVGVLAQGRPCLEEYRTALINLPRKG
ncbi:MAG: hypothetical protein HY342_06865 [Candidatus Lambdaproteobacteria bacterium]|nr:hypothetical protein [Candidatus Lambdaproteobacteria bacterium]